MFVADTHAVVWYLSKDRRLSPKVSEIFHSSEKGKFIIIISTIVLAEILYLAEKKKLIFSAPLLTKDKEIIKSKTVKTIW